MEETVEKKKKSRVYRRFLKDRMAVVGIICLTLFVLITLAAPLLTPYSYGEQRLVNRYQSPGDRHLMGTDHYGRDIFSRVLYGGRVSLLIGFSSVFLACIVGTIIGMISGFLGGRIDVVISWFVDILMSFPTLLMGLIVVVVIGPGLRNLIFAIAISILPRFIRLGRGSTIALREREYILATKALGIPTYIILIRHVLVNILGPTVIMASLWIATAIRIEASLSFLGLGVQPPYPSWGNMIKNGVDNIFIAPWIAIFPGIALTIVILSCNLLGDGLRDAIDPKQQF